MDAKVPLEVTNELTQILSNLVLGDNEIRSNAEKIVNERLSQTPELYILALAQFTTSAPEELMRSFSLILLRRLLFRSQATSDGSNTGSAAPRLTLYDQLSERARESLEKTALHNLLNEPSDTVKPKVADTIADLANASFQRGRPWPDLQEAVFRAVGGNAALRETAFRVLERCAVLLADVPEQVFISGLQDSNTDVRLSALKATAAYLSHIPSANPSAIRVLGHALSTLPTSPNNYLTRFLNALTPLATSHPSLFAPHLPDLLRFLPSLVLNKKEYDAGPTPTVARPFPNGGGGGGGGAGGGGGRAFTFPPPSPSSLHNEEEEDNDRDDEEEEANATRLAALEFMLSLSEAKPSMVRRVDGWVAALVRACLEGMGELDESDEELRSWLDADPTNDPTDTSYPSAYEQALDRLSCAFQGRPVLQLAFAYIPGMLASHDWRLRHAGLMAIAAMGEGGARVMQHELGKVVSLVTSSFHDSHPRVRFAACQCIGQLCTDLEDVIQSQYHAEVFAVLIPTLEAPEPRVHAHAAAALINFCEGVARETLIPYLDAIVERLLKMLHGSSSSSTSPSPSSNGNGNNTSPTSSSSSPSGPSSSSSSSSSKSPTNPPAVKGYVQEQAVTTLAMVADASETTFAKHYASIMPLLLNVLQNANGTEHKKLRWKAMECAGLIAIAVGRDVFRPDSGRFVELLMRIQNTPIDPGDTMLNHYLIATWAKVCQALGTEFEPYLPVVMPPLLRAANAKADVSVWDDDHDDPEKMEDREGWETMSLDGQQVGIKTAVIEEKCQAFETLVIYVSTLQGKFAPYLPQCLELVLPSFRFYFHEGVREACALVLPMLLVCGKNSGTLTPQMLTASFSQLVSLLQKESDTSFLSSLFRCFTDCVRVIGGPEQLAGEFGEYREGVMGAVRSQLQTLAEKRKVRVARHAAMASGSVSASPAQSPSPSPTPSQSVLNGGGGGGNGNVDERLGDDDLEDMQLLEELEDFALDDMAKLLRYFDVNHPLLIAVGSVKELGIRSKIEWDGEEEE